MPVADASPRPADRSAWLFEALRVRTKFARFVLLYKAGFDPDQPRVPAGHPDGGQWTGTGASRFGPSVDSSAFDAEFSDTARETDGAEEFDLAIIDGPRQYSVDLDEQEAQGGHTLRRHVRKSKEELIARLREIQPQIDHDAFGYTVYSEDAIGSFVDKYQAIDFVNRTIRANKPIVDRVSRGELKEKAIQLRFGHVTGKEAFRRLGISTQRLYIRPTYAVRVVLVYAPHTKRGYRVKTAYPVNGQLEGIPDIKRPVPR